MRARMLVFASLAACSLPYPANVGPTDAPQGTIDSPQGTIDSLPGAPDAMVDAMPLPDAAPGTLGLDVDNAHFYLRVGGGMVSIGVTISRGAGVDGDVTIAVPSPPNGVTFDPLTIPSGSSTGTLMAHVPTGTATLGESTVTVSASATGATTATDSLDLEVIGKVGAIDPGFGTSGTVTLTDSTFGLAPVAIFAQADKLVVVMTVSNSGLTRQFVAYRLQANGSQDSSFGVTGTSTYDFNQIGITGNVALAATMQADGSIVLGGSGNNSGGDGDPFIARITADGTIDTSLGPLRSDTTTTDDRIDAVAIDTVHPTGMPDRIVLAGANGGTDTMLDGSLMPLTAAGALDPTFGASGRAKAPTTSGIDQLTSILVQPSGAILAVDHLTGSPDSQTIYAILGSGAVTPYTLDLTGSGVWFNAIGLENGSAFFGWGENGGRSGVGVDSTFLVSQCSDNGNDTAHCIKYEAAQTTGRTQALMNVVAIPDGSGYLGIGYDLDDSSASSKDYTLDTVDIATNLAPISSVGTNGIVRDTSVTFQPFATVAQDNHRYAVFGVLNPANSPSVVVRRYFW